MKTGTGSKEGNFVLPLQEVWVQLWSKKINTCSVAITKNKGGLSGALGICHTA